MTETTCEQSSMFGNKTYKAGEAAFLKYFDNTSQSWERLSGSGAPNVNVIDKNIISVSNSSSGSLASGSTFTGSYIDAVQYDQANMLILTDQPGTLYFDHSIDGVTSPPTRVATFGVSSGSSATYFGVTPRARYFRVRFTCTGSGASNYNLQTTFSDSVKGFTFMPTIVACIWIAPTQ